MLSKISFCVCLVLILSVALRPVDCASPSTIKTIARRYIGSTTWSYASSHRTGANTNKCNIFVADVLRLAAADAPNRWPWYSPIGAMEWANSRSTYLIRARCWQLCYTPRIGDVIATGGHVGIVTGTGKTTSAARNNVVENNWGFRGGQSPTCWRYQYYRSGC